MNSLNKFYLPYNLSLLLYLLLLQCLIWWCAGASSDQLARANYKILRSLASQLLNVAITLKYVNLLWFLYN